MTENLPVKLQRHKGMAQIFEEDKRNDSISHPTLAGATDSTKRENSKLDMQHDVKTPGGQKTLSLVEECSPEGFASVGFSEDSSSVMTSMRPRESNEAVHDGMMDKSQEDNVLRDHLRSRRLRSRGRRSASEGVAAMRLTTSKEAKDEEDHFVKLAKLVATSTKELPKIRSLSDLSNIGEAIEAILHEPESLVDEGTSHYTGLSRNLSKKKRLKKSFSEGVSFMTASFENNTSSGLGLVPHQRNVISTEELHNCNKSYLSQTFDVKSNKIHEPGEKLSNPHVQHNACPRAADKIHQIDQRFNNGMKTEGVLEEDSDDQSELSIEQVGLKKRDVSIDPSTHSNFHILRSFLLSSSCKTLNVFASLSCFFLVGMRMNSLLVDSHEIDRTMVFTPNASHLFWAEVSYYSTHEESKHFNVN
jgi:hypothetical protein